MYQGLYRLTEKEKVTISTTCTCTDEDDTPMDCCGICWECDLEYLDELVSCPGEWHVDAEDIGWQNRTGEKDFICDNSADWMREVCGFDCDYTMQVVVNDPNHITAYVYHHDSPMGELREVRRVN